LAQQAGGASLGELNETGKRHRRGDLDQEMHVVGHHLHLDDLSTDLARHLAQDLLQALIDA